MLSSPHIHSVKPRVEKHTGCNIPSQDRLRKNEGTGLLRLHVEFANHECGDSRAGKTAIQTGEVRYLYEPHTDEPHTE